MPAVINTAVGKGELAYLVTFAAGEPDFLVDQELEVIDMGGPSPRRALNLMGRLEAAKFLNLSLPDLDDCTAMGWPVGPGHYLVNGHEFWALQDLEEWEYRRRLDAMSGGAND